MPDNKFLHNDLRYYVRFLWDFAGVDVRFMVPGFEEVIQAEAATIENVLESEDELNAQHMETYWLHYDKALTAVSMRQSDGYSTAKDVESFYKEKNKLVKANKKPSKAYIGLARVNAERSKSHLKNVPVDFEMKPNFPERDKEAVAGVNHYRDEILNRNNWESVKDKWIDDIHDFGSGILHNPYRESEATRDMVFFEERIDQGQPLEWEEYLRYEELARNHIMEYVDTFEVIRDRRARGAGSMDFNDPSHTIVTRMENIPVAEAMSRYPKHKDRIRSAGVSELYRRVNPRSGELNADDVMVTCKHTWVPCPVRYQRDVKIHLGGGNYTTRKKWRQKNVILRFKRLETIGIVAAYVDEYMHGEIPLTMCQRRPSKLHAYGIGAYKDMWAPEWAYNIAFNGKFDWFNRSSKGIKYVMKGLISQDQIDQASQSSHGHVEIDPEKLGPRFKNATMDQLIKVDRPPNVPTVFSNFEVTMEDMVNRQSGWYNPSGKPAGSSGRQENILTNQSEMGMENPVRNLYGAMQRAGDKFFWNIVQFDGEHPMVIEREDPATGQPQRIELNKPVGEVPQFDPMTGRWKLFAYEIKNSIKSLDFSTQVTARSIVPVNPTEQRFFWQDITLTHRDLFTSEEGLVTLEMLDEKVFGGILSPYIKKQRELFERRAKQQQLVALKELQQEAEQQDFENMIQMAETLQNKYRLEKKAAADLLDAVAKFGEGNSMPLQQFLMQNPGVLEQGA